jgi:hypothetical protein
MCYYVDVGFLGCNTVWTCRCQRYGGTRPTASIFMVSAVRISNVIRLYYSLVDRLTGECKWYVFLCSLFS